MVNKVFKRNASRFFGFEINITGNIYKSNDKYSNNSPQLFVAMLRARD